MFVLRHSAFDTGETEAVESIFTDVTAVCGTFLWLDTSGTVEEFADKRFMQVPNLQGRHVVQGLPAFTQAHPLQEPVLLHRQHGILVLL